MILVTGGTGLVGAHLLYELVSSGKNVRATYRREKTLKFFTMDLILQKESMDFSPSGSHS